MFHKTVDGFPASRTVISRGVGAPKILIFSSVLRFIEEQVNAVPDHLETGGLLLGTVLDDGRLITHATPPGPKAIHQEGMFGKDKNFSQAILNHLAKKTGVDYVGEWHKHPPFLKRPSHGDRQGAIEILQDPDYQTKGLLVFPIWIKERRGPPSSKHEKLIEHYFGPMHAVQCYPYYMDETFQFYPFEFHVVKCDLGTQSAVIGFYNHYMQSEEGCSVHRRDSSLQRYPQNCCKSNGYPSEKEGILLEATNGEGEKTTPRMMDSPCLWHETQEGRKRLAMETESLKNSRCYRGARILKNGRLLFRLSSPVIDHVFLDVLCKNDHPRSFPDLFLSYQEQCRQIKKAVASESDPAIENAFSKTMLELNELWKEPEESRWVFNIVKSLGFH